MNDQGDCRERHSGSASWIYVAFATIFKDTCFLLVNILFMCL